MPVVKTILLLSAVKALVVIAGSVLHQKNTMSNKPSSDDENLAATTSDLEAEQIVETHQPPPVKPIPLTPSTQETPS